MAGADLSKAIDLLNAGDWDGAHALVQDDASPEAAWIHAHLHRVEGDPGNAAYWYRRAGRPVETGDLDAERRTIAASLTGPIGGPRQETLR
jgi:hypothetical protein